MNLPPHANIMELKAELWEFFEKRANQLDALKSGHYVPRIVDIYFGMDDYATIRCLSKIKSAEKAL